MGGCGVCAGLTGAMRGPEDGRQHGHSFLAGRTTLGDVVGFSTACFTPGDFPVAALACKAYGGNAVELDCAGSTRTEVLTHAVEQLRAHGLRPSVLLHDGCTRPVDLDAPLIVPADQPLLDVPRRLTFRNATDPDRLDQALRAHPAASLCLDASLAFACGGFAHLKALAADHAERLSQVNVGTPDTEAALVDLVCAVFDAAGRAVPVIIERPGPVWAEGLAGEVTHLRALARRFLTPYR